MGDFNFNYFVVLFLFRGVLGFNLKALGILGTFGPFISMSYQRTNG